MQPRAVLILFEPGHKFKNYKYLLSLGSNIVGRDNKCQVIIDSKDYFSQQYVANFNITQDFMYIQALCDNMIQFKSNMQIQYLNQRKKQVFKYIQKSCRYLVPIEQFFYIGPYKAMVQIQNSDQLKNIHNLLNLLNFQTPQHHQNTQSQLTKKINIQQKLQRFQVNSDKTQKIQSDDENYFVPTLLINDDDPYYYQPTLLIDHSGQQIKTQKIRKIQHVLQSQHNQNNNLFSQRKNQIYLSQRSQFSQISMFSKQKQKKSQKPSQQILYETIKKQQNQFRNNIQNNKEQQQDEVSMPDTIKDQQIKDQKLILQNEMDSQQMPATLKNDEPHQRQHQYQQNSISKMKGVKSMYENNNQSNNHLKMYKSQIFSQFHNKKLLQQQYQDDDLWDALMGKSNKKSLIQQQVNIQGVNQLKQRRKVNSDIPMSIQNHFVSNLQINPMKNSLNNNHINQQEKQQNQQYSKINNRKSTALRKEINQINSTNIKNLKQKKKILKQQKKYRLVNICGFKPKLQQKLILRKRGFQIVSEGKQQNYDILIIGKNCKTTPKLLLALITDTWIVSQQWLYDKDWQKKVSNHITGTIDGLSWQIIQKNIKTKQLFNNETYYLTDTLQQYVHIVQIIGGNVIKQLNKRKKMNIIINCQSQKDQQFYKQNKNCKNWKFYDHRIIAHSILTGQIELQKYKVDSMSF